MKNIIGFLFILILSGCKAEKTLSNVSCGGKVSVQYEKAKRGDKNKPKAKKEMNGGIVYFINEFDDQIQAYINDKLYFEKHVKVNPSDDGLIEYFAFGYPKDSDFPIIKIVSKTQNTCFDIPVNKKYKLMYVFLSRDGKWTVRFSNIYYIK